MTVSAWHQLGTLREDVRRGTLTLAEFAAFAGLPQLVRVRVAPLPCDKFEVNWCSRSVTSLPVRVLRLTQAHNLQTISEGQMIEKHQDDVKLNNGFTCVYEWLQAQGEIPLATTAGTLFTVRAATTSRGAHAGERVIRFFQKGREYARAYECCWGHYYNCNRTRIGMYCKALDAKLDDT